MDSGIFIAALSRADEWHAEARALFGGTTHVAHTSLLVVGETYA